MIAFADTSFLCALHVPLEHSTKAISWYRRKRGELVISGLVAFEFRQSLRLQVFRHNSDRNIGFDVGRADAALAQFDANLQAGAFRVAAIEMADVLDRAERLSARWTEHGGYRSLDVLHIATAQHLKADRFLSFDSHQRRLAESAGLKVGP